ncbi:CPXCG motif-containing cysteine-rich protein [Marinicella pacifica]|uniref:CPXCG motif-containing cysteine-rich protein n=1 Tax=Marinicella pacifica TaxID=1171543 RepID=A0A917CGZ6_9GAMM|nr:CPXCG motif-containing cysteine-rich protein [Marinicella pacifica]GGF86540.1 CPXCG motif-containing cysteine-rich protein [Marinicella pacifica]
MSGLLTQKIQCPYCWETFETVVDCSVPEQVYVEDCFVCCQPIVVNVVTDGETIVRLDVSAENQS